MMIKRRANLDECLVHTKSLYATDPSPARLSLDQVTSPLAKLHSGETAVIFLAWLGLFEGPKYRKMQRCKLILRKEGKWFANTGLNRAPDLPGDPGG